MFTFPHFLSQNPLKYTFSDNLNVSNNTVEYIIKRKKLVRNLVPRDIC